jgi:hypothetical protein
MSILRERKLRGRDQASANQRHQDRQAVPARHVSSGPWPTRALLGETRHIIRGQGSGESHPSNSRISLHGFPAANTDPGADPNVRADPDLLGELQADAPLCGIKRKRGSVDLDVGPEQDIAADRDPGRVQDERRIGGILRLPRRHFLLLGPHAVFVLSLGHVTKAVPSPERRPDEPVFVQLLQWASPRTAA